jgi:hypothetical protein
MLPLHLTSAVMTIMAWTWKQIEQDWLAGGRVATEPSAVVEAFEGVEAAFGREWIERSRVHLLVAPKGSPPQSTVVRGSDPVLTVVQMGALLTSLEGIPSVDTLMQKLRRGERAAMAEATAIHLLRQHPSDSVVELEPAVPVAGRSTGRATSASAAMATPGPTLRLAPPTRPPPSGRRCGSLTGWENRSTP